MKNEKIKTAGTIVDRTPHLREEFESLGKPYGEAFEGDFNEFLRTCNRSPFIIVFDEAVKRGALYAAAVEVSAAQLEANNLKVGKRVECVVEVGRSIGDHNRLVTLKPL